MDTRKGGHRYCPSCKQIVETRVLLEGYCQTEVHGIPAKKRQVICGTEGEGTGCGPGRGKLVDYVDLEWCGF